MRSAEEWCRELNSLTVVQPLLYDRAVEIVGDLAAMEKLAIGGEGETHYFYRDVVEAERKRADDLQSRLDEVVRALEAYMKKDPSDKIGVPASDESAEYKQATEAISKAMGVK